MSDRTVTLSSDEMNTLTNASQMLDYFGAYFKEKTLPRTKNARDDMIGRHSEFVDWLNSMKKIGDKLNRDQGE